MDSWVVTLVCGASGVGKSRIAVPLAARYGVPLAEADDIVTALQAITTPAQQPELHYWATHPESADHPPERIADLHLALAQALRPAFEAVIADHLEFAAPVVFEGDYLLPDLAARFGGRVRAVVVTEPDPDVITANLRSREPANGHQSARARASAAIDSRLVARARACGQVVVPARPWADAVDRTDRALRTDGGATRASDPSVPPNG